MVSKLLINDMEGAPKGSLPEYQPIDPQYPQTSETNNKLNLPTAKHSTNENTVIVTQPCTSPDAVGIDGPQVSTTGATLFSCFVCLCCCCPLGLAAFIVVASANTNDIKTRAKVRIANILSTVGLLIGLVIIMTGVVFCAVLYAMHLEDEESYNSSSKEMYDIDDQQLNKDFQEQDDYSSIENYTSYGYVYIPY